MNTVYVFIVLIVWGWKCAVAVSPDILTDSQLINMLFTGWAKLYIFQHTMFLEPLAIK